MWSFILGKRYESRRATVFNFRKLKQNLSELSFFGANILGLTYSVFTGSMTYYPSLQSISVAAKLLCCTPYSLRHTVRQVGIVTGLLNAVSHS